MARLARSCWTGLIRRVDRLEEPGEQPFPDLDTGQFIAQVTVKGSTDPPFEIQVGIEAGGLDAGVIQALRQQDSPNDGRSLGPNGIISSATVQSVSDIGKGGCMLMASAPCGHTISNIPSPRVP